MISEPKVRLSVSQIAQCYGWSDLSEAKEEPWLRIAQGLGQRQLRSRRCAITSQPHMRTCEGCTVTRSSIILARIQISSTLVSLACIIDYICNARSIIETQLEIEFNLSCSLVLSLSSTHTLTDVGQQDGIIASLSPGSQAPATRLPWLLPP